MDQESKERLDSINLAELGRGFRLKDVPDDLRAQLRAFNMPDIAKVRFQGQTRYTHGAVATVVQKAYHRDLKDKDLLSNAQILALVAERGEWTPEIDEHMKDLQKRTNSQMTELYLEGFASNGRVWLDQIMAASGRYGQLLEEHVALEDTDELRITPERRDEILVVFQRWLDYSPERATEFAEKYAVAQGKTKYSPDADQMWLLNNWATIEQVDLINTIEDLKDKLQRFLKFTKERQELATLQIKHAKIFADSVESRRDNTEELARMYFTTFHGDVSLTKTYDEMLKLPDDFIQWLLVENYFFHNAIPDEARPYLETFGFIRAEVRNGESPASAESPEAPTSKTDSSSADTTPELPSVPPSA